mgnify:FL=1
MTFRHKNGKIKETKKGEKMKYGYARVSTSEQDETRQVEMLLKAGVEMKNITIEKKSGKDFKNRTGWKNLLAEMVIDDIVVITSLDRMGRNYDELVKMYQKLIEKGIGIEVLDFPMLSTTTKREDEYKLIQQIALAVLSYVAENERKTMKKRQRQGYDNLEKDEKGRLISRKKGVVCGRPNLIENLTERQKQLIKQWIAKTLKTNECLELTKISRSSLYRIKKEMLENN